MLVVSSSSSSSSACITECSSGQQQVDRNGVKCCVRSNQQLMSAVAVAVAAITAAAAHPTALHESKHIQCISTMRNRSGKNLRRNVWSMYGCMYAQDAATRREGECTCTAVAPAQLETRTACDCPRTAEHECMLVCALLSVLLVCIYGVQSVVAPLARTAG